MLNPNRRFNRLDLRALPIAVKITIGTIAALLIGGLITDQVLKQVVSDSLSELALTDLQAISRSEALHTLDILKREVAVLTEMSINAQVQDRVELLSTSAIFAQTSELTGIQSDVIVKHEITAFKVARPEFIKVIMLDTRGHILAAEPALENPNVPVASLTWYSMAIADGKGAVYLSGPIDDPLTGEKGVHIAIPVYNKGTGALFGILYGIVNIREASSGFGTGSGRDMIIMDENNQVLYSPVEPFGQVLASDLITQLSLSPAGSFTYADKQGNMLYGHTLAASLQPGESYLASLNWVVIIRQPFSVLDENIALVLSRLRLVLSIVAGAAALGILLFSRILFIPLRQLTLAAQQIERGDFDTVIPSFPLDEIGRLATVLNHVVQLLTSRFQQLRKAVQVSRTTSLTLELEQLLGEVATSLGKQFSYPDVRIFLPEMSNRQVRLGAAYGDESERLLHMGYRLPIDENSLVGRAALLHEVQIGGGRAMLRETDLIGERAEIALPLQTAGQMLGVVHIIAARQREFEAEDVDVLRLITDQLGMSIQNARLFEQSAASLREIEALNRRLTRQGWEEYAGDEGSIRHTPDPDQAWPEVLPTLMERKDIKAETYTDADGRSVLAAPLMLRGETFGTLAVTRPGGETWSPDELLLLEAVAARMGVIAETIRLVDETTRRADREQRINDASANMLQRATSVDTVLRSALNELGNALGSDRVSLRLGTMPARDGHQIGAGAANPAEAAMTGLAELAPSQSAPVAQAEGEFPSLEAHPDARVPEDGEIIDE